MQIAQYYKAIYLHNLVNNRMECFTRIFNINLIGTFCNSSQIFIKLQVMEIRSNFNTTINASYIGIIYIQK